MNLKQLRTKRTQLQREAEGLRGADGAFKDDQTRAAFDAKMSEIDTLDQKIRELLGEETEEDAVDADQIRAEERARAAEIRRIVGAAGLDAARAEKFVIDGTPLDAVRSAVLNE